MSERLPIDARLGHLHELINDHPDFELVPASSIDIYCFRYVPNDLADRQDEPEVQALLDQLNKEIVAAVRRGGMQSLMTIAVHKRVALRLSLRRLSRDDVDKVFEAIARWGRLLTKTQFNYERSRELEALSCSSESCFSPTAV
jgi:glutamate/tyrosine decarboxylase-like PLP-dependent enzyme